MRLLFHRGVEVYMITGGFRDVIEPLADYLGIPRDHVFANKLFFKEDGKFTRVFVLVCVWMSMYMAQLSVAAALWCRSIQWL